MKYSLIILLSLVISCNYSQPKELTKSDSLIVKSFVDTITNKKVDSLNNVIIDLKKQYKLKKDSLFAAEYTIGRVRYRIKICEKNPKLKVFFYGWTKRIVAKSIKTKK